MYELIKRLCAEKGISPTKLCTEITGSKGNLPTWQKGNVNPKSLIKIADYFDVSVDYLLGRADAPTEYSNNSISNSGDVALGTNAQVSKSGELDGISREMIAEFEKLEFSKKAKVISLIAELSET